MRWHQITLFIFILLALVIISIYFPNKTGFVIHPFYPAFSEPINSSSINYNSFHFNSLSQSLPFTATINDDAVYSTAYISYDGGAWQPLTLYGNSLNDDWISGTATLLMDLDPNDFKLSQFNLQTSDNYLLVYSCNNNSGSWNCSDYKWQIFEFNVSLEETTTPDCHLVTYLSDCEAYGMCDANADGIINFSDVSTIQNAVLTNGVCGTNNESCFCDIDQSGGLLNILDAALLANLLSTTYECGNNIIEPGEQCDNTNLSGYDCTNFNFDSGILICSNCSFDTSGCYNETVPTGLILYYDFEEISDNFFNN
jgi:hypothetical protein